MEKQTYQMRFIVGDWIKGPVLKGSRYGQDDVMLIWL